MNCLYFSVIGGIFAGLISTGLYELIRYYYDKWVYFNHPIEYKYIGPDKGSERLCVYNTWGYVSADFYLKNRTKGYLPILVSITSCDCITYDSKPIEWMNKKRRYGLQEIVLSPSEWGRFRLIGKILQSCKFDQHTCDITINLEVKIPYEDKSIQITLGTLRLEFK